jgi:hypothetical protein
MVIKGYSGWAQKMLGLPSDLWNANAVKEASRPPPVSDGCLYDETNLCAASL